MAPPSTFSVFELWERARSARPVYRAVLLASAMFPELEPAQVVRLTLGERDAALLAMREAIFGSRIEGLASCPACGQDVEISFEASQAHASGETAAQLAVEEGGHQVRARVPTSLDMAAIEHLPDAESARAMLLDRCVDSDWRALPESVLQALVDRMAQSDPQADVRFALECPECAHRWAALFDIVPFLWREIDVWAQRLMREVHALASTYGWSEADILALSPWRRQMYVEMAGA